MFIFLLIVQIVLSLLILYLLFKLIPQEKKQEVMREAKRAIGLPLETKIIEWQAKEDGASKAFKEQVEKLKG
ncbi:MAG: hypothetical protein NUV37_03185 [Nanoarchaeota archaeon]|nr:hypothetical protein [Nanoarchaeota archaeon]